jgi:hypothetical protein
LQRSNELGPFPLPKRERLRFRRQGLAGISDRSPLPRSWALKVLYVAAFEADPRGEVNQWWRRSSEKCDEEIVGGEPAGNTAGTFAGKQGCKYIGFRKGKVFAYGTTITLATSSNSGPYRTANAGGVVLLLCGVRLYPFYAPRACGNCHLHRRIVSPKDLSPIQKGTPSYRSIRLDQLYHLCEFVHGGDHRQGAPRLKSTLSLEISGHRPSRLYFCDFLRASYTALSRRGV